MAGGAGRHGTLYLLDMGQPIRIRDLAEQMIRFYGYEPGTDIAIRYIGLRPGEKLDERLWDEAEAPQSTTYPKIMQLQRSGRLNGRLGPALERLRRVCYLDPACPDVYRDRRELRRILREVIPTLSAPDDEPRY